VTLPCPTRISLGEMPGFAAAPQEPRLQSVESSTPV
jgi:hypothetical protein